MIHCTIGGITVYPAAGLDIKLVMENPYLKESGSHTFEITFPLDIPENRVVFGCVNRLDVSKRTNTFGNCKLFDGSRLLLSGTGTVVSYSNESVKLQLLAESRSGRSSAMGRFIRDIAFPEIDNASKSWCKHNKVQVDSSIVSQGYGGVKGRYAFFTICNVTTGNKYNLVTRSTTVQGGEVFFLKRPVLQPNLMYVLNKVLEGIGYQVTANDFDQAPWNCLYIVNLKHSTKIENALPKWKVETFLTEFCKLFNAVLLYDDDSHTVQVKSYASVNAFSTVSFERVSAFESEYDEDGISFIGSDNIRYNLESCGEEKYVREIPADALEAFAVRHYTTLAEMTAALGGMTEMEKKTTIFLCDETGYRYYRKVDEQEFYEEVACGFFTVLVKEGNTPSSPTTDLRMVPAPIGNIELRDDEVIWAPDERSFGACLMPCGDGPDNDNATADDEDEFTTVQEVLENGVSVDSRNEEDDVMMLVFLAEQTESFRITDSPIQYDYIVLKSFADRRESNVSLPWSLALAHPGSVNYFVGQFHRKDVSIDAHNMIPVQFFSDKIPDPKSVFIFDNKRFLCARIEAKVSDSGLDNLMKGYFYEML